MGRIVRAGPRAPEAADREAEARGAAEGLLRRAREEAAALLEEAAGERRRLAVEVAEAEAAGRARSADRDRLRAEAEAEILPLALAVAGKVLAGAVADGAAALESARKALAGLQREREAVLRAHPDDAGALREAVPSLAADLPGALRLAVRADPAVGRGGVVVESEAGTVDARLEAQLQVIAEALGAGG